MPTNVVLLRHPGLPDRSVPSAAALQALSPALQALPRRDIEVDTRPFAAQIDQGDWEGQAAFLAAEAAQVHSQMNELGDAELHYFGLAEIPHVIALGAFIGDEQPLVIHEFNRDAGRWTWPEDQRAIELTTYGLPTGEPIPARGSAILRVEISFAIADDDIHAAAGTNHLVEVRIGFPAGALPEICKVRSAADLLAVRTHVRTAIAAIRTKCPNLETLHVFAAAPASVCFALGQELKPRNSPPIQTYRYRQVAGQPSYKPALELSGEVGVEAEELLTTEETATANQVRDIWRAALNQVETYAGGKGDHFKGQTVPWYEMLQPTEVFREVKPFPPLMPVHLAVPQGAQVDTNPVATEYGFTKPDKSWHLSDRLLVSFSEAANGDPDTLQQLIRLFLFHEYLHDFHSLTKYRAEGVGTFANCLEFIDYTADTYALLHQLDLQRGLDRATVSTDDLQRQFLVNQLELVLASFWAFERRAPVKEWQVRRLRRYLNWYWRLVQVQYATDLLAVVRLFARPPHVELAGVHQFTRGRRLYCRLDKLDSSTDLELAVVLENCKLLRVTDSTTTNLEQLLIAFQNRDHESILKFFRSVYEQANDMGGAVAAF